MSEQVANYQPRVCESTEYSRHRARSELDRRGDLISRGIARLADIECCEDGSYHKPVARVSEAASGADPV